jgi:Transposase DDE domain/Insertion element 4 transposase N-terminal
MRQQAEGTLPMGGTVDVLDRLQGLTYVIHPDTGVQVLHDTGHSGGPACCLTPEVTCWVVLAMGLFTDLPLAKVFQACRCLRLLETTPRRSSLCEARKRLGSAPLQALHRRTVRLLATADTPGAFYHGLRLMAVDGTVCDVPDFPANVAAFGRPTGGRGDGAFPQVRKVSLLEVGTHVEWDFALGPCTQGETSLLPNLLHHLQPGMLLLWDRNFYSFALWKRLVRRGVHLLVRLKKHLVLRPLRTLADGSYLAKIYRDDRDRRRDRRGIRVRVLRYTLDDPQRVGDGEEHRLLTSLLDAAVHPALTLITLYHERWEIELVYDEQKTHQDPPRATKPTHLRSQTPEGIRQELYALSLGHFVTRALMARAAARRGLDPERLSFLGCLQSLRNRLPECAGLAAALRSACDRPVNGGVDPAAVQQWYEGLLWELGRQVLPPRANRVNPRVVKRKMSKFKKKRPEHRPVPPMKKTFDESVVMLV